MSESTPNFGAELVRKSPQPCAVLDQELRYLGWSESWLAAFRLPPDTDLAGRSHYAVFPEIPERWKELHRRCLAGETLRSDYDRFERSDGSTDHVRWEISPWYDDQGQVAGVLMFSQTISEEVERKIEEQAQFQRALFEKSPVGMNLCRLDGLWVESNAAFLTIIGYSEEEADGKLTYWELTPRSYDAQEAVQIESLMQTGRYGPYEKEFIRKDGSLVPVRLSGFLIERAGERYIWSLIEDITQRKELEAEFERERLRSIQASKLAMLGEMAAGIAHEINNPLAIVHGYLQLLVKGPQPESMVQEAIQAMSEATGRADRIVQGLRKFARADAGDPLERVQVRDVVRDTLDLCAERLSNHGVELRLDLDCEAETLCRVNELSQVLLNLITNAFHAVEGQAARWIELSVRVAAERVEVQVRDSGPGIPEELREKVFQPFFTTKEVGKGTGLGLSISRGIVEDFGGTIRLDMERERPTCVAIDLPRVVDLA